MGSNLPESFLLWELVSQGQQHYFFFCWTCLPNEYALLCMGTAWVGLEQRLQQSSDSSTENIHMQGLQFRTVARKNGNALA